jgi:AcrR family transcriptional regulator
MTKRSTSARASVEIVLDAAARLFRGKGFAATTVREIAQAAGMLPGSLHYRFASKEAILVALMERALERVTRAVREAIASSKDPVERLRLALRTHLAMLVSGDDSVYVLLYDWRAVTGEAREAIVGLRERYEALWDGLLYAAAGAGRLRPRVDLRLVRLLGVGALNWAAQWFRRDGERTPEEVADALWAFLAFGVLCEETRPADVDAALAELSAVEPAPLNG